MLRLSSIFGFALVVHSSVFATGCIAETNEPEQLIWYDDELGACYTTNEKGQSVQVPCEESATPGLGELAGETAGCTGTTCCQTKSSDGICPVK